MIEKNIVKQASETKKDIIQNDNILRPENLEEYIGQDKIKANLKIFLGAAKKRKEPMEHVLLHGSPGLGKTTLAFILAKEMGAQIKITSGPAIEKPGDLASMLSNLKANNVLFIDEIHRLRPAVEEILYSAMEDSCLDLMIGKGPSARSMRLKLPKFTLIGATTKLSSLSSPFRDRFGNILKLDFYSEDNLREIIERSAKILNIKIDKDAAMCLSKSARRTPRIANRLLRRVRDFTHVNNKEIVSDYEVKETMKMLGIDELGLDDTDRRLLRVIMENFKGGPVGLSTIAAATNEEMATIEDIYEPYLMQLGFLERTPRGRHLTEKVYNYMQVPSAKGH